jgi:gluconate 2-dehydrogenase gamma chain
MAGPAGSIEEPATWGGDGNGHALKRRGFLLGGAVASGIAIASAARGTASAADATPTPTAAAATSSGAAGGMPVANPPSTANQSDPTVLAGFSYFNNFQAAIVQAAAARLIPTDANGPGATEAGVVYFIDRQLENEYGFNGMRYVLGPFQNGAPTQGDQSGMSMRERYRLGIQGIQNYAQKLYQNDFVALTPAKQDRILTDLEKGNVPGFDGASIQAAPVTQGSSSTEAIQKPTGSGLGLGASAFFSLLQSHTIAGFFADPIHGGNHDMVGWKLIGFPGAQMSYASWISRYGVEFSGAYHSIADYQAQFGKGM